MRRLTSTATANSAIQLTASVLVEQPDFFGFGGAVTTGLLPAAISSLSETPSPSVYG